MKTDPIVDTMIALAKKQLVDCSDKVKVADMVRKMAAISEGANNGDRLLTYVTMVGGCLAALPDALRPTMTIVAVELIMGGAEYAAVEVAKAMEADKTAKDVAAI